MSQQKYRRRNDVEDSLLSFLNTTRSGLVFLRGRRRVGKSELLNYIQKNNHQKTFYFTGALDENSTSCQKRFVQKWLEFYSHSNLKESNPNLFNWEFIFEKLYQDLLTRKTDTWLLFDEIQWLAKGNSGFVGLFKAAWLKLSKIDNLKIVLCGSSNKFFVDNVGGEEKILRGLTTRADIIVRPFTPDEVSKYYAPKLSKDELHFLYFCFGGIPYYLEQFDFSSGFITGFNQDVFLESSIFVNEINECLNLDFNSTGIRTAKKIFSGFKTRATEFSTLLKNTRLAQSTLSEMLNKLIEYKLICELESIDNRTKQRKRGVEMYYPDFFINFYFRFLVKHISKIKRNKNLNLFSSFLTSKNNLYIENFTGCAFENYIQYLILNREHCFNNISDLMIGLDEDCTFIQNDSCDLLLKSENVKILRFIECKWANNPNPIIEGIKQLSRITDIAGFTNLKYLITNFKASLKLIEEANKNNIKIFQV